MTSPSPPGSDKEKILWSGKVISVQPRIRLMRSFDQRSHSYLGYCLQIGGVAGGEGRTFAIGIGKGAHAKHKFRAGDLVSEWVAIMNGGVKLSTLASAVHPYPTLGEINKRVAGTFFSEKLFSERVRKGMKFFFHLKGRAYRGDISDPSKSILENPS